MLNHKFTKLKAYLTPFTLSLAGFLLLLVIFHGLAEEVGQGKTLPIDEAILVFINNTASGGWDQFFVAFTTSGGGLATAVIAAGLVGLLLARKRIRDAVIIGGTVAGAAASVYLLKLVFSRPRPDLWQTLVDESTYSFPSGHAVTSSALALSLMVVAWSSRWRWPVIIFGTGYILAVGYSRLYLGVHYPTDIIASWLLSSAWLIIVYWVASSVFRRVRQHHSPGA